VKHSKVRSTLRRGLATLGPFYSVHCFLSAHCRDVISAEVKKAHNLIMKEDRRKIIIRTIENATEKVEKERRVKVKKGIKEKDLGDLKDEVEKAVLRAFAEIENRRRNIETREAALRRRETEKLDKEQKEVRYCLLKLERTYHDHFRLMIHAPALFYDATDDGFLQTRAHVGRGRSARESCWQLAWLPEWRQAAEGNGCAWMEGREAGACLSVVAGSIALREADRVNCFG
jgi:hypothetical protein